MAKDGFGQLLRAEWTKLRSVRRWVMAMLAAIVLTIMVSVLAASGSGTDANQYQAQDFVVGPDGHGVVDDFHFVHQPLPGDGTITARVISQQGTHEWAAAGLMVKESTRSGSPYAAVMVTATHGVRLRANFDTDIAGGAAGAPRWLRLTRSGTTVTGYESADGSQWREVGTVEVRGLPQKVEVGMAVMSPPEIRVERRAGSTSVGERPTTNSARFDNVHVEGSRAAQWSSDDVGLEFTRAEPGGLTEADGVYTVTGSGDIAPKLRDDDPVQNSLFGALVGLIAIAAVSTLFVTSEYRRGMIRTTFVASPRRGRVLAAKALVVGGVSFVAGLIATFTAFLLAQPILRDNGFAPPAYRVPSLTDWPVLRAVVGTAAFLAVIAVFSLGVGTILRRSAGTITVVVVLVVLPTIVATLLPTSAARLLMLTTPAGGFAIQRAKEPTAGLVEPASMISPWVGFGVVCAYAAAAMAVAYWMLRRRDA